MKSRADFESSVFLHLGKLIVANGIPKETAIKTEVIDLLNPQNICEPLEDFPKYFTGTVGGSVGNNLIISGGCCDYSDEIYIYSNSGFTKVGNLLEPRESASSISLDDSILWIIGGSNRYGALNSTEFIQVQGSEVIVTEGPILPSHIMYHCTVKINETVSMLIG